ncbi:hypothetical protein P7D22_00995 [Lichenihabitans sp. Uapishka_5]|uniref:hypothetical protein n=1 Tax=Lichenihabitans sp. Uapishka_5 TaxID=3037302 RepID=UPI0029E7E029|nr:hypothetical protein [Lichenihabitans sp. Uapishka_5]MDX7949752.1 hypothetical protein [Lichenihabitans sp. Uapishka_5]
MPAFPSLEDCFRQGTQARDEGRKLAENPYSLRTPQHREWAAGWCSTFDLDEDDDPESMRVKSGATDKDGRLDDDEGPISG